MHGEKILHVDDQMVSLDGMRGIMDAWGAKSGHMIVGQATSKSQVEKLLEGGLKPTVALVDNKCPNDGDGEAIAKLIREKSPQTVIVSFSSDEGIHWGDHNLLKLYRAQEIVDFLTNLQH